MGDFKSEQIEELVNMVRKACIHACELERCRFELYMNSQVKPRSSKENHGVERAPALLDDLRRNCGLACEVKDTQEMSSKEIKGVYGACANWASNPARRDYPYSRMIFEIFEGGMAGDYFGKEKPAMIVYKPSGDILSVLPHIVTKKSFSLKKFVERELAVYQEEAIITIYEFLAAFKHDLEKRAH